MRIAVSGKVRCAAAVVAAALSLTSLSACGGSSGPGDAATLEMWTFKQSHVAALRNAAEEFRKQTGISVRVEAYTPDDAYTTKVQSAAKTHDLPDVLETHSDGEDMSLGAAGIAADLRGLVPAAWSDRFEQAVRTSGTVTDQKLRESQPKDSKLHGVRKGQRFSVPFTTGTFGIVYANKRMLADAGVTRAPATWEEFLHALGRTHAEDPVRGGISLGLKVKATGLTWVLQPLAFAQLGKERYEALFGRDASRNFASPDGTRVLSMYDRLTPYWMPGTQSLTIDEADQAFAQGKSAFDVGGTFTLAFLRQNGVKADDVLAFGLPAPERGAVPHRALGPLALTGLTLTSTSAHPDNARKWMEFLSGQKVAARFAKDSADLPATALGAEGVKVLGPTLGSMIDSFDGAPGDTYDPSLNDFRPPGYDQDPVGEVLADLTPLRKSTPAATGQDMRKLIDSYWAESK
ncbi:sugar ABC transporter substrate-binding protein [Streptomyces sulfonofaciens]|uniref:Sugar ABC transporter substrate-binding protein n=1 Tax=Streptomyces sulfonofaciens TaxID=68272 RepID=A0A919FWM5_9ACTN|nr:extracellular solute-binding protein [Streptomyces sulfonofaciens]GHH72960.1 sugar ABC transporter substrate-binding protein [Streptomyces sulfonofaciens]